MWEEVVQARGLILESANSTKALLFFCPEWDGERSEGGQSKTDKCCKHTSKDSDTFLFPWKQLWCDFLRTLLSWGGKKIYVHKQGHYTCEIPVCLFITFSLYFYIISLSSESSQSDLGPSHPGVSGFTVPVRRASWWSFLRAACLGSASRSVSCPPGAWRRAGRWGWPARHAGPGGAAANGQSVEAGWDTATSRTLSGPPGPSPAGIPRGPGQLDHMHL